MPARILMDPTFCKAEVPTENSILELLDASIYKSTERALPILEDIENVMQDIEERSDVTKLIKVYPKPLLFCREEIE